MDNLETDLASPEPAFRPLSGYALRLEGADRSMLNHLAAHIETKPSDLLSHTRRILIAIDLKDPDELFGALVDLFIAKGDSATNVRANLLQRATALLSARQQDFLRQHLTNGLTAQTPVPMAARCSRLTAGLPQTIHVTPHAAAHVLPNGAEASPEITQALQPNGKSAA